MTNLIYQKTTIRSDCREKRSALSPAECKVAAEGLCEQLKRLAKEHPFQVVSTYSPIQNELSPMPFLHQLSGVQIVMPRFIKAQNDYDIAVVNDLDTDLSLGNLDIKEPLSSCPSFPQEKVDLWLVPGLAFDATGARLGFGAGIYDQFLAASPGLKVGLAYNFQVLDKLPQGDHDIKMDYIVTPTETIRCTSN